MSKWVNPNTVLVAMLTAIATLMLASNAFMRWPDLPTLLLGTDKGLIEQASIGITAIALIIAGYFAARTFQQQQRMARTAQFEKAAELLSSDKTSANMSGLYIMFASARDYPKMFWEPASMTFALFIMESTAARHAVLREWHVAVEGVPVDQRPPLPAPAATPYITISAITALSQLRWIEEKQGADVLPGERRLEINNFTLDYARFKGTRFDRFDMENVFIDRAYFEGCRFDDSAMHLIVVRELVFSARCDLSRAKLRIFDMYGNRLGAPNFAARIVFVAGCKLEGATVFDRPIDEFLTPLSTK